MKENSKTGRGGARIGAGRPKSGIATTMVSFRCPTHLADRLGAQKNRAAFIKNTLQKAFDDTDNALTRLGTVTNAAAVKGVHLPFYDQRVVAGFPVPLDNDERSQDINILTMLCPHPEASYLIRVNGDSMIDAGIESGDIVIVDKSNRTPSPKEIAVCELNGEYTLKHFVEEDGVGWLVPDNPKYPRFKVSPEDDFSIWGTVTYIIHKARG